MKYLVHSPFKKVCDPSLVPQFTMPSADILQIGQVLNIFMGQAFPFLSEITIIFFYKEIVRENARKGNPAITDKNFISTSFKEKYLTKQGG